MTLQEQLAATLGGRATTPVAIPGSGGLRVGCRSLRFVRGDPEALPPGTPLTYSRKPLVNIAGRTLFAELAVVRLFVLGGWQALWCDGFSRGWVIDGDLARRHQPRLPDGAAGDVVDLVSADLGGSGGCWDVVAWKDDRVVFAECKRTRSDRVQPSQGRWLDGCLARGLSPDAFVIVEWDHVSVPRLAYHAALARNPPT